MSKSENKKPFIGTHEQAEKWMVNNKNILYGYKVNHFKKRDCMWSLFTLHNESFNVWSHLIGALCFIYFTYYVKSYMAMPII